MLKLLQMTGQVMLLWIIYWLGNQITVITGLPVPGTVFGMVLLFLLLLCGIIKLSYIQEAADFLLKHMLFFFIPIAVGLMDWGAMFYEHAVVLTLAIVAGAVLPFFTVGIITQLVYKEDKKCK
ncbi:putative effector of murein hydrolase LrgA [uncultured Sporomusa sp.]|uniref:Putative effector of murein hydrolase LrgA n=2 Tax=uncultured Sporomusa sp. TaxID=307249 RepID=A0A212LNE2_9FIRM|nr:putative effector of murein hydrolase LrgA [uncultured Sporomusa sp.]